MESTASVELQKDNEAPQVSVSEPETTKEQETSDQPPLQEQQQLQQQQSEDATKPSMKKWQSEGGLDALRKKNVTDGEVVSSSYGLRKRRSGAASTMVTSVKEEKENTEVPAKKRPIRVTKKENDAGEKLAKVKDEAKSVEAGKKDVAKRRTPRKSATEAEKKLKEEEGEDKEESKSALNDKKDEVKTEQKKPTFVYTTMDQDDLAVAAALNPVATAPVKANIIQPEKPTPQEKKEDCVAGDDQDDTLTEDNADRSE